jgi:hypothetical protein
MRGVVGMIESDRRGILEGKREKGKEFEGEKTIC